MKEFFFIEHFLFITTALIWLLLLWKLKFDKLTIIILSLTIPFSWYWLSITNWQDFTYDVTGHIEYIKYISKHWSLPPPKDHWLFYHPPFYYFLGVIFYNIGEVIKTSDYYFIRLFSFICYLTFLTFSAKILELYFKASKIYYSSLFLMALWPLGTMLSLRIDNNLLMYALCCASYYYFLKWYLKNDIKCLSISICIIGIAIATRTNSVILLFCYFIIFYQSYTKKINYKTLLDKRIYIAALILLLSIFVNAHRNFIDLIVVGHNLSFIVGNGHLIVNDVGLFAPNKLEYLFGFSWEKYFNNPFFISRGEETGKNYFLIVALKSMLYGEFQFSDVNSAKILNLLLLIFLAYLVLPTFLIKKKNYRKYIPLFVTIAGSFSGLFYNRWSVPVSCSADFRYIYYAIIPMIIIFSLNLDLLKNRANTKILYYLGSILYFIIPVFGLAVLFSGKS